METLSRSEITREALRYMGLKCKGVPGPDTKEIMGLFSHQTDMFQKEFRLI